METILERRGGHLQWGPGRAAQLTEAGSLVNRPAKLHTKPQGSWKEENAHIPATSRSDASENTVLKSMNFEFNKPHCLTVCAMLLSSV